MVFLVTAGIAVYQLWPDVKHDIAGYSFEETLAKTTDAAGGDARVLTFLVRGEDFSYQVVTPAGKVLERFYGELCTSSSRGNHCANRESATSGRTRPLAPPQPQRPSRVLGERQPHEERARMLAVVS